MLPGEIFTRWISVFVAILIVDAAIVLGVVRFTHVRFFGALGLVSILLEVGILVWFIQSPFKNRKTLREWLLVYLGLSIVLSCSVILMDQSDFTPALLLVLILLVSRRIWGRPLLKKLRAETEWEKTHRNTLK